MLQFVKALKLLYLSHQVAPSHCANITPCRTLYGSTICVDYRTLQNKGAKYKSRLILLNHVVTPHRSLGYFVHPTLPLSFGRDNKSRWSLLSSVYARAGEVKDHTQGYGKKPVMDSLTLQKDTLN